MNHSNDSARDTIPCLPPFEPYSDSELDAAMRELEELEAAEADARYQRKARFYGLSLAWRAAMAAMGLACVVGFAGVASAEPAKAKRPTICVTGTPVSGQGFSGYLCTDGKRPKLFTRFMIVRFIDDQGNPASYVLGWTSVQPKATPAPVATLKL